jgi:dTDP-4-dehydrorhamnose reductase
MKVAVLGANGFLGKFLTKQLTADGYEVLPVSRYTVNLNSHSDVQHWLKVNTPDAVINCATAGGKAKLHEIIYEDLHNNLSVFMNFYNNSNLFGKFINVGSGAEFDMTRNLDNIKEQEILSSSPKSSYGYSKNIIARLVLEKTNFYTLRLFGCFDASEPNFRLLRKALLQPTVDIVNKKFDYISARDFYQVVKYYLNNQVAVKDINCVYPKKIWLPKIVEKLKEYQKLNLKINVVAESDIHYTGNGYQLEKLGLPLEGLDIGLKNYND